VHLVKIAFYPSADITLKEKENDVITLLSMYPRAINGFTLFHLQDKLKSNIMSVPLLFLFLGTSIDQHCTQ